MVGRFARVILIGSCIASSANAAQADFYTGNDPGGMTWLFAGRYKRLLDAGERVVINGNCMSACTMVLSVFPRDRICVTKTGALGFHAARLTRESAVAALWITDIVDKTYPPDIRNWIVTNNATDTLAFTMMRGEELQRFVQRCEPKVYASIDARRKTPWPQATPLTPKSLRAMFPLATTPPAPTDLRGRFKLIMSNSLKPGVRASARILSMDIVVYLAGFTSPGKATPKFDPDRVAALLDKRDPPRLRPPSAMENKTFDPSRIAALLDKRDPSRTALPTQIPNMELSADEIAAFRNQLMALWNPPHGSVDSATETITVRINLTADGQLSGPPIVLTSGNGATFSLMRDSAVKAIFIAQPYKMFKKTSYEAWKQIDIDFDPRSLPK